MWIRAELKQRAKDTLKSNYWILVLGGFILAFISGNIGSSPSYKTSYKDYDVNSILSAGTSTYGGGWGRQGLQAIKPYTSGFSFLTLGIMVVIFVCLVIGLALSIFLFNPLIAGGHRFFNRSLVMCSGINEFAFAFKGSYKNVVKIMFLKNLYTFLWSLLFVIPGIVKSYEYYMVPYIIGDNPDIDASEAFRISKEMMYGNKLNAWVLDLSFIGWNILSVFTCGLLGIFFVIPYTYLTRAALYRKLGNLDFVQYDQMGNNGSQWGDEPYQNNSGNDWGSEPYQNNSENGWGSEPYQNNSGNDWQSQPEMYNNGSSDKVNLTKYNEDYYSGEQAGNNYGNSEWDSSTNSYKDDDR